MMTGGSDYTDREREQIRRIGLKLSSLIQEIEWLADDVEARQGFRLADSMEIYTDAENREWLNRREAARETVPESPKDAPKPESTKIKRPRRRPFQSTVRTIPTTTNGRLSLEGLKKKYAALYQEGQPET